jgi:hypothetical protein
MTDNEKKELADIGANKITLVLGGKTRVVHYGLKAWKIIREKYKGFDELSTLVKSDALAFITETLPELLLLGLKAPSGETISLSDVEDWLDEYDMKQLKDIVATAMMNALSGSMPVADKSSDPQEAEKK